VTVDALPESPQDSAGVPSDKTAEVFKTPTEKVKVQFMLRLGLA
jgi:hypothetical protein